MLFLGVAVSGWLAWYQSRSIQSIENERFTQQAKAFSDALQQRIAKQTEVVKGFSHLFVANPALTRSEFERVVSEVNVGPERTGIRRILFARKIRRADRPLFEALVKSDRTFSQDGFPVFSIKPSSDRAEYVVVDYLWPRKPNDELMGFDLMTETDASSMFQYLQSTRNPVVAIQPIEGSSSAAASVAELMIRVPVFDRTGPFDIHGNPPVPRFIGVVSSTIGVEDLVDGLKKDGLLKGLSVQLEDRGTSRPRSTHATRNTSLLQATKAVNVGKGSTFEMNLAVHDRLWHLTLTPTERFVSTTELKTPLFTSFAALFFSGLLAALVHFLSRQRSKALVQAQASDFARLESEDRFRALFNQAAVGVAQLDAYTGRFESVNQKYADILGYSPSSIRAQDFNDLIHPLDVSGLQEYMELLSTGKTHEFRSELRCVHQNGSEIWVELTVSQLLAFNGQPESLIAVMQDITERKKMEELLRGNEVRLRRILQRLPVGVCLIQSDGRIRFRNDRFSQICGYSTSEIPTLEQWWIHAYPEVDQRDRARASWLKASNAAVLGDGSIASREQVIFCKDEQKRSVEISGVVLGKDYLVTLVDLSQRKAAEEEVKYLVFYDPLTVLIKT